MALFDFLKRKKKQEKEEARKAEKKEVRQDSPAHEPAEGESSKQTSFLERRKPESRNPLKNFTVFMLPIFASRKLMKKSAVEA